MKFAKLTFALTLLFLLTSSFKTSEVNQDKYEYIYWYWNKEGTDVYYFTEVIALKTNNLHKYSEAYGIIKQYLDNNVQHTREAEFTPTFDNLEEAQTDRKKQMNDIDYIFGKFKAKGWSFPYDVKNKIKDINQQH
jgi:uncharacterized protein (UPF0335 family)